MRFQYSPLRYPGGKAKLVPFFQAVLRHNGLCGGHYVEPYAGGAGVALALAMTEYARHVFLNDVSFELCCFWKAVLDEPERLCQYIMEAKVTPAEWWRHKSILKMCRAHDVFDVGFAFLFLNRTNRSGVLNAGMIGGNSQEGRWKIDARFNKPELIRRIQLIAGFRDRITVTNLDALVFLDRLRGELPKRSLVFSDPPYYKKGQRLYRNAYTPEDHSAIAEYLQTRMSCPWVVSYDSCDEIKLLYSNQQTLKYSLNYSAHRHRVGSEIMFFSEALDVPEDLHESLPLVNSLTK